MYVICPSQVGETASTRAVTTPCSSISQFLNSIRLFSNCRYEYRSMAAGEIMKAKKRMQVIAAFADL
jgi:hypothetical protein